MQLATQTTRAMQNIAEHCDGLYSDRKKLTAPHWNPNLLLLNLLLHVLHGVTRRQWTAKQTMVAQPLAKRMTIRLLDRCAGGGPDMGNKQVGPDIAGQ